MLASSSDDVYKLNKLKFQKKYELNDIIAKGAFGIVYKAKSKLSGQTVAVKIISKNSNKKGTIIQIQRELNILQSLSHPNILKLIEYYESQNNVYIVTEYIQHGNLKDYLSQHKDKITEQQIKTIAYTLLQTVKYLHKNDICHRDLKLGNIMLSDEKDFNKIKIIDFGLSIKFQNKYEQGICGTMKYMAPEVALGMKYIKNVDIWSIGIILFLLFNKGKHPFYETGEDKKAFMKKIGNLNIKYPSSMSLETQEMLMGMLEKNYNKRLSAEECLNMKYFNGNALGTLSSNKKKMLKYMLLSMVMINQYKKKLLKRHVCESSSNMRMSNRFKSPNMSITSSYFNTYSSNSNSNLTTTHSTTRNKKRKHSFKINVTPKTKEMFNSRTNWIIRKNEHSNSNSNYNNNIELSKLTFLNNNKENQFYQKHSNAIAFNNKQKLKLYLDMKNLNTISPSKRSLLSGNNLLTTSNFFYRNKLKIHKNNHTLENVKKGNVKYENSLIPNYNNFSQNFVYKMFVITSKNKNKSKKQSLENAIKPHSFGNNYLKTFYQDKFKLPNIKKSKDKK